MISDGNYENILFVNGGELIYGDFRKKKTDDKDKVRCEVRDFGDVLSTTDGDKATTTDNDSVIFL